MDFALAIAGGRDVERGDRFVAVFVCRAVQVRGKQGGRVYGIESHGNGGVAFDVEVRREEGGELVAIPSGHRTVVVDAAQLNAIADKSTSTTEKLKMVAALIREDVATWRVDEAEDAANWLLSVVPEMSREDPLIFPLR